MKLNTKVKVQIALDKMSIGFRISSIVLIIFLSAFLISKNLNINTYVNFKDPGFSGIFGSFIGAITGGIITLFINLHFDYK